MKPSFLSNYLSTGQNSSLLFRSWVLASILGICCFSSCVFDGDERFYPRTVASFFLFKDTVSHTFSLAQYSQGIFMANWHETLGFQAEDINDLTGSEDRFWIASGNKHAIYEIDPDKGDISTVFELGGFSPHFIQIGETYMIVSDSLARKIGFLDLKTRAFVEREISCIPGPSAYRSGKFYLICGGDEIRIFQEDALAEITALQVQRPIVDIQVDNKLSTFVFTFDSTLYQGAIDYNTNSFSQEETQVSYSKIRFSPFRKQYYGKEYLGNVSLSNAQVNIGGWENVSDFAMDFFDARVFFLQQDSLFSYELGGSKSFISKQLHSKIYNSWFDREIVGE